MASKYPPRSTAGYSARKARSVAGCLRKDAIPKRDDEREGGQLDEAGPVKPRRSHAADQVRQHGERSQGPGEVRAAEALAQRGEGGTR